MAVQIKPTGGVSSTISQASNLAQKKGFVETTSIVAIGSFLTTGAPFSRSFPSMIALNQWLTTGAAADVDITRVEQITFVQ